MKYGAKTEHAGPGLSGSLSPALRGAAAAGLAIWACLAMQDSRPAGRAGTPLAAPVAAAEPAAPKLTEVAGFFRKDQSITDALLERGLTMDVVVDVVEGAKPVYDLSRVAASRPYWLGFSPGGTFQSFRYPVDEDHYLRVYRDGGVFRSEKEVIPYQTSVSLVSGHIDNSLFVAVSLAGEQERLALDIADIFLWDIDFNTELRKGDSFAVLVEKDFLDGKFVRYGSIVAAGLKIQGRNVSGFRFPDQDGKPGYYGPDGRSLRKAFLKSPIPFGRVTSRFSGTRRHPILNVVRPHLGIDYAAPVGTPVVAVGSGKIVFAGSTGNSGKLVKIRHANGYETIYLHLSRILVAAGTRVEQGQVIGRVGATGLATGPHLDFRVSRDGRLINPARIVFPPSPPVPQAALAEYAAARVRLQAELERSGY